MIFRPINIELELKKERQKNLETGDLLLDEAMKILSESINRDQEIINVIREGYVSSNFIKISEDKIDNSKVFSEKEISKIASKYRLRLLDSKNIKGEIPYQALVEVRKFENQHNITLTNFKVFVPLSFLTGTEDFSRPILMVPIGNDNYYIIYKWGGDLEWYRSLLFYPFRNLSTMLVSVITLTSIITLLIPTNWLVRSELLLDNIHYYRGLFFVSCFVWISVIALYIGLVANKGFGKNYAD